MTHRDADGNALDEHAHLFRDRTEDETKHEIPLPRSQVYTGERLALLRDGLYGLASIVAGEWDGASLAVPEQQTRWSGIGHALAEWIRVRTEGYGGRSLSDPRRIEQMTGQLGQFYVVPGEGDAVRLAADLHHVGQAWDLAFDPMPETGGIIGRTHCELALVLRYVGGFTCKQCRTSLGATRDLCECGSLQSAPERQSPTQIAEYLSRRLGWPVTARLVGRVTRHGATSIYAHLRSRELIPEAPQSKEGSTDMGTFTDSDLFGWKEIAAYFEVSPDTVRDWHRYHGMPVRRFRGRVEAKSDELNRWREELTQKSTGAA